jgi:hypothetical protein
MTSRARRLLDALEDGCITRPQIFAHQGRFSLLNNAAAELRAAGVPVACELVDGDYLYWLLDGGRDTPGGSLPPPHVAPTVEQPDGQLVIA